MTAQPARAYFGIGEVLARLRPEFPDVSVSKIRFLESEGLIEPARAPSGYRRFAIADVERLRYILTAQRDEYLPLRVIKERLLPDPAGDARRTGGNDHAGRAGPAPGAGAPHGPLSRRELLAAAGIDAEQLDELEAFGVVRRVGRAYPRDALRAAAAAAMLAKYGVQARHLRAIRAAVERETSFIEQLVAPLLQQRKPQARQQAGQTAREIAGLTLQLHGALVEAALAEAGFPGDGLPEPAADTRMGNSGLGNSGLGNSGLGNSGRGGAGAGGTRTQRALAAGDAAADGYGGASA
jgi:DNA-binding transcriptional MerR regulator